MIYYHIHVNLFASIFFLRHLQTLKLSAKPLVTQNLATNELHLLSIPLTGKQGCSLYRTMKIHKNKHM